MQVQLQWEMTMAQHKRAEGAAEWSSHPSSRNLQAQCSFEALSNTLQPEFVEQVSVQPVMHNKEREREREKEKGNEKEHARGSEENTEMRRDVVSARVFCNTGTRSTWERSAGERGSLSSLAGRDIGEPLQSLLSSLQILLSSLQPHSMQTSKRRPCLR